MKFDGEIDSTQHSLIEVSLPVGCAYQENVRRGFKTVDFPQESWENSSGGFMHAIVARSSNSINLIDENDWFPESFAGVPDLCEFLFAFSVVLRHNALERHVDQWYLDLLSYDFRTCCLLRWEKFQITSNRIWLYLSGSWRAFEEHGFWSIWFYLDSSSLRDFIEYFRVSQSQKYSVFYISFLGFITCEIVLKILKLDIFCFMIFSPPGWWIMILGNKERGSEEMYSKSL